MPANGRRDLIRRLNVKLPAVPITSRELKQPTKTDVHYYAYGCIRTKTHFNAYKAFKIYQYDKN